MSIYFTYFGISLIGLAISCVLVLKGQTDKAKTNNVAFPWKTFWGADLWIQIVGSILTTLLFLTFLPDFITAYGDKTPKIVYRVFFALCGYFGSDLSSRFFSRANDRINAASGYKSKGFDEMNGTADTPTPAAKPTKP